MMEKIITSKTIKKITPISGLTFLAFQNFFFFLSLYWLLAYFFNENLSVHTWSTLSGYHELCYPEIFLKVYSYPDACQSRDPIKWLLPHSCFLKPVFISLTCLCFYYARTTVLSAVTMPNVYPPSSDHLRVTSGISYHHFICYRKVRVDCFPSLVTTDSTVSTGGKNNPSPVSILASHIMLIAITGYFHSPLSCDSSVTISNIWNSTPTFHKMSSTTSLPSNSQKITGIISNIFRIVTFLG